MDELKAKIFSDHLIKMLAVYNETGQRLIELEEESYALALGKQKTTSEEMVD